MIKEEVTITSDETNGTWTNNFMPSSNPKQTNHGYFGLTIRDNVDSNTITLRCSIDGGDTWEVVETYTVSELRTTGHDPTIGILYQAGCANGDWSTGSPYVALTK